MASSAGVLSEMIAAGCGPVVKMWAPSDPHKAIKLNKGTSVYCLDFSHNNKVLAVGGESGQATLYSMKGASVAAGALEVGQIPRTPEETVDSFTCIKFAPNDSYIVGGCTNGQVHLWNLKGTEVSPCCDGSAVVLT
jgi:WD40 repeat protein